MSAQENGSRDKRLLTTGEAAELLSVHPNTLRMWADANLVPSFRIGPRKDRRFKREDLEDYLNAGHLARRG